MADHLSRLSYRELVAWADEQLRNATPADLVRLAARSCRLVPADPEILDDESPRTIDLEVSA